MDTLPWWSSYLSGSFAGVVSGCVGHPLDTVKLLQQTSKLSLREACWRALTLRGLPASLGVQLVSSALLYGTYVQCRQYLSVEVSGAVTGATLAPFTCALEARKCQAQVQSRVRGTLGLAATMLRCGFGNAAFFSVYESTTSGLIAGVAYWAVALPFDAVKSRQQVLGVSFSRALRLGHLWEGWLPVMLRAAPMSATSFAAFQLASDLQAAFLRRTKRAE